MGELEKATRDREIAMAIGELHAHVTKALIQDIVQLTGGDASAALAHVAEIIRRVVSTYEPHFVTRLNLGPTDKASIPGRVENLMRAVMKDIADELGATIPPRVGSH